MHSCSRLILASTLLLCTTLTAAADITPHIVLVGGDGKPRHPETEAILSSNEVEAHLQLIETAITDYLEEHPKGRVLLHAHGGLSQWNNARQTAQLLTPLMLKDGIFPVFLIWSSDLLSAFKDQAAHAPIPIVDSQANMLDWTTNTRNQIVNSGIFALRLIGDTIIRAPRIQFNQWKTNRLTITTEDGKVVGIGKVGQPALFQNSADLVQISLPSAHKSVKRNLLHFALYIRTAPTKFVLGSLFADAGKSSWHNMRTRSRRVFRLEEDYASPPHASPPMRSEPSGGLSQYIAHLDTTALAEKGVRVDLVGHSMGAIIACEIASAFPTLPYRTVLFMAAACTAREFETAIIPLLQRGNTRFYNLCLHPEAEIRETNYADIMLRGSLLRWLDTHYLSPESESGLTFGQFQNALRLAPLIPPEVAHKVTIKGFGYGRDPAPSKGELVNIEGEFIGPQKHGDFGKYPWWKSEFLSLDSNQVRSDHTKDLVVRAGHSVAQLEGNWTWLSEVGAGLLVDGTGYFGISVRTITLKEIVRSQPTEDGAHPELELMEYGFDIDYLDGLFSTETFLGVLCAEWKDPNLGRAHFMVIEPSYAIHSKLWRLEVSGSVGYRRVLFPGVRNDIPASRLSGMTAGVRLAFH